MATSKPRSPEQVGKALGFRSGLEAVIAQQLEKHGIPVKFEEVTLGYIKPQRISRYTPDFVLPNGIIIETKGRFVTADRQKHKWLKEQHPDLDVRFVFSRAATRISKKSKTSYADWCEQYGFTWHDKVIPLSWLQEPVSAQRLTAIKKASK